MQKQHLTGASSNQSLHVRDPRQSGILDSTLWIPDSGFQVLDSSLCQRNLVVSGIPDSLSCIPDSKAQDSGFDKRNKFLGFRYLYFLTWGETKCRRRLFLACSLFPIVGHAIIPLQRTVSLISLIHVHMY